ncbi:hypothetical protein JEO90_05770 [Proteus vulgaris]|uniref:hypothetical protein n=1 Tax=Proteus TaxID=583 RepID=UPI0018E40106|nr:MULTISPECIES: hypothetical protein [Proteus]MBI6404007.1 hypothetical protein [Proteus sp. PR00208]MBI6542942.1 hypothetical protein [Proteus vulgaris]
MKKPISLWIILIVFIFFTLGQLISSFTSVSTLVGISIKDSENLNLIAYLSILWSLIQTFTLPTLYVITLFVIFMNKEIASMMLKIFWSISMLPITIAIVVGMQNTLDNTSGSNQAENSGEVLGSLFLVGLLVYLTYSLFFSLKIKQYFQYLKDKQSTACIDKN